jgi:hypothetical protein
MDSSRIVLSHNLNFSSYYFPFSAAPNDRIVLLHRLLPSRWLLQHCACSTYSPWAVGLGQAICAKRLAREPSPFSPNRIASIPSNMKGLKPFFLKYQRRTCSSSPANLSNSVSSVRLPLHHGFLILHHIFLTYSLPQSIQLSSPNLMLFRSSFLDWGRMELPSPSLSLPLVPSETVTPRNVPEKTVL